MLLVLRFACCCFERDDLRVELFFRVLHRHYIGSGRDNMDNGKIET